MSNDKVYLYHVQKHQVYKEIKANKKAISACLKQQSNNNMSSYKNGITHVYVNVIMYLLHLISNTDLLTKENIKYKIIHKNLYKTSIISLTYFKIFNLMLLALQMIGNNHKCFKFIDFHHNTIKLTNRQLTIRTIKTQK